MEDRVFILKSDVLDRITEEYEAGGFTDYSNYNNLWDSVDDMPAADVQPVKHGEWKINSDGYYPYCSECGTAADQLTKNLTKYCPECGARIDLKGGDANG